MKKYNNWLYSESPPLLPYQ